MGGRFAREASLRAASSEAAAGLSGAPSRLVICTRVSSPPYPSELLTSVSLLTYTSVSSTISSYKIYSKKSSIVTTPTADAPAWPDSEVLAEAVTDGQPILLAPARVRC